MSDDSLNIIFMGTPDFAEEPLRRIVEDTRHNVIAVYSQPPRPKGRGHQVQKSPVHEYADSQNIPVYTPQSLKGEEAQQEFAQISADVAVVAAYGLILPQAVLDAPAYGCLNIHASLLPRWRGAAPIQYAIWAGDTETGISIMQMEAGLDTGPVIWETPCTITGETTASALHDELCSIGAQGILEVLDTLAREKNLPSAAQDNDLSTYASTLKKEDGIIDWSQSAAQIDRQIRALNPWPGVWTNFAGKRIKIHAAKMVQHKNDAPAGTILDKTGLVTCGDNTTLIVTQLQPEGKKPMDFASALNGGYVEIGAAFL